MTSSADERGKPTGGSGEDKGKTGSAVPGAAPAKPGATGSSAISTSATPRPAETVKPVEPVKSGAVGGTAAAPGNAGLRPGQPQTVASRPDGSKDSPKPAAAGAVPIGPGQSGSATVASSVPGKDASGGASKDATVKPGVAPAGSASTAAGSGSPGPTASSGSSPAPAAPVKSGATGSSAVPPAAAPPSASAAARPESPVKSGTTGSSAFGADPAKAGAKPSATSGGAPASGAASRVKPEDALTDGPILDLKANAGGSGPRSGSRTSEPASPPTPSLASGPGLGALATSGLVGGLAGALALFLLSQAGLLPAKGDAARLDALDRRISALAPADAVSALDKRVAANEATLKRLPESVSQAQAAATAAGTKADQAIEKVNAAPAAGAADGSSPAPAAPADLVARLDALDQRVSALQEEPARDQDAEAKAGAVQGGGDAERLTELDGRLKALETKGQTEGASAAPFADLSQKIAALRGDIDSRAKANETADAALGQRLDQLQQSLDGRITAATEAVQQVTQASRQTAEAGKVQADEAAKAVDRRLQEQADRIATLDKTLDGSAKAATVQAALRVVAANRISDALATGAPYSDALDSLRGGDAGDGARFEPLAAFAETGAPTAATLADAFRPIADKIATARRSARSAAVAANGSIGDRLMSMAESVVQVKRVAPGGTATAGTASPSPVSPDEPETRVQDALDHGRLGDAAEAFAALPGDVQAEAKEFGARLKSAADANAAAQTLQAEAFKALPAAGR